VLLHDEKTNQCNNVQGLCCHDFDMSPGLKRQSDFYKFSFQCQRRHSIKSFQANFCDTCRNITFKSTRYLGIMALFVARDCEIVVGKSFGKDKTGDADKNIRELLHIKKVNDDCRVTTDINTRVLTHFQKNIFRNFSIPKKFSILK